MNKLLKICVITIIMLVIGGCTLLSPNSQSVLEQQVSTETNINKRSEEVNLNDVFIELSDIKTPIIDKYAIPFPRLAMWWLDPYEESSLTMSQYDLLLNEMDGDELIDKVNSIRQLNEDFILLRPLSPSEHELTFDWMNDEVNVAIKELPTQFFLMHQGSTLVKDISDDDTRLYLDNLYTSDGLPLYLVGDDIAIGDNESATILSINESENHLTVERGYIRDAEQHKSGDRVAAHVRFWPGSWVMNITSACPKLEVPGVDYPIDYISYYHLLINNQVDGLYDEAWENPYYVNTEANYNGFAIDRFEDHQSWLKWTDDEVRLLDPYYNGTILRDTEFDGLVMETVDQLTDLLNDTYNNPIIIRNNAFTIRHENHHGQVFESFGWDNPSSQWWESLFGSRNNITRYDDYDILTYLGWFNLEEDPLIFMEVYEDEIGPDSDGDGEYINPLENEDYEIDHKKFRFSLTSTLLGDGFYSYEVNTNGHGALGLLWFDAYDLGTDTKGYLGFPTSDYREIDDFVFIREFENGFVIVNASDSIINPTFSKSITPVSGFDPSLGIDSFDGCIYLYD